MTTLLPKLIRYLFYGIFLFVPLTFWGDTSELFEFNKMWLTFILAICIGVLWSWRMILEKQWIFKRTPLDIPIGLFLASQILSTIFSLDPHTSWWGYYSRFNGGLLSLITYIFLYYGFASNVPTTNNEQRTTNYELRTLYPFVLVSLISGFFVCLWGLPSHFGYDPTCYIFRGTFDVSCWTDAFQPKVRMFSTLGQPDWLASYLGILIPLSLGMALIKLQTKNILHTTYYVLLTVLFYICFTFSDSRGGFIGLIAGLFVMAGGFIWIHKDNLKRVTRPFLFSLATLVVISFFIGTPLHQFDKFTFSGLKAHFSNQRTTNNLPRGKAGQLRTTSQPAVGELGGTDSGKIRLYVWRGAIDAWRHYPVFGTGVETFAYAYYLYRPIGHNLTSEWDYLYNKAHNEYLNYAATTGTLGLVSYLAIIFVFLFIATKQILRITYQVSRIKDQPEQSYIIHNTLYLLLALLSAYVTILVSNFFGFSVVMVNIYLFLIPTFALLLITEAQVPVSNSLKPKTYSLSPTSGSQYFGLMITGLIGIYLILVLANYWSADRSYGLGYNLDRANAFDKAHQPLLDAYTARPDEPQFSDELSLNTAVLAEAFAANKDATTASQLTQQALTLSNQTVTGHPNVVTFWKTRVRIMYALSQINDEARATYLPQALSAIATAHQLAPTDAKISYNYGLLLSQNGKMDEGIKVLNDTTKLKPDYRDTYYALGILLHEQALNNLGKVVDTDKEKRAVAAMDYILTHIGPDPKTTEALTSWGEPVPGTGISK